MARSEFVSGAVRSEMFRDGVHHPVDRVATLGPMALSEKEAFQAMREFLDAYWERDGKTSDDLAALLGAISTDIGADGTTGDPAQWHDWLEAVKRVREQRPGRSGRNHDPLYVVVRVDPHPREDLLDQIALKMSYQDLDKAVAETERLNDLQRSRGIDARYEVVPSRLWREA